MLSAKHRDLKLQSCDDISALPTSATVYCNSSTAGKISYKSHHSGNSLPIPTHTRAASTPVHMEKPQTDATPQHRRFPSCVESTAITPRHIASDPGFRKETKKFSLENYGSRNDDRESKRASSEAKEKVTKRNSSSPAAISLLNFTNEKLQKLSFDELNRNKQGANSKQKTSLKATPELLAELLKGSSEKMVTAEQNKKGTHDSSNVLPTAVLRFLVSRCR